jgi:PilZ domain
MGAGQGSAAVKLDSERLDRGERRPVRLRAYIARAGGATSEILMLDLSYEGCGIETSVELRPGEAIKLSVVGRGAIGAHVRWYCDGKAGLVFDPEKPKQHWPRRSERTSTAAEVSLRRLGQVAHRVRVTDLSPEGCKVELIQRPDVEERMLIKFEGLEALEAEVCWVERSRAGLRFEKPMHPAVFDLLLQRLR